MLVQVDGSDHDWFEGRGSRCALLVYIDDATSRILHAEFVEVEDTLGYEGAKRLEEVLKGAGLTGSLLSFEGGHGIPRDALESLEGVLAALF